MRVQDNSVNKEMLLEEFDELSQVMVSELEYEKLGEWVVPLIQAGTWLRRSEPSSQGDAQRKQVQCCRWIFPTKGNR